MATLRELILQYTARLEKSGVDSPRLSAEVLLATASGMQRSELLKHLLLEPEAEWKTNAETLVMRRERGEPVAYITGVKEFYGREFAVTPDTLIPRPDTETLIDAALQFAAGYGSRITPQFMDMGTGSGAIAVTLALELPAWQGMAVDISSGALDVAAKNASMLGAANVCFLQKDFLSPDLPVGPYDMLLANPPYVSEAEYAELSPEVAAFEPKTALVPNAPNASGLEFLHAIMEKAITLVKPGGLLLMELGCTQGEALMRQADASNAWMEYAVLTDLGGLPRVFRAIRRLEDK